jgi:hypothetical protein
MTSGQSGLSGGYTQDGYTVEASSELTESGVLFAASNVFNSIQAYQSTDYAWSSAANRYGTGGLATNGTSKDTFQGIDGSWIGLTLPIAIRLDHIHMYNRAENSVHVCPAKSGIIWASNDGISWYRILSFDNLQKTDGALNVLRVNSTNFYTRYRVQITANNPDPVKTAVMIGELELFGTPEYDPDAHGTDVTVKSYPNVPNTDWLEVYYDAKGETTMPNPVTDLAGGDQDASVYGVTLDTTNEAFVFNGSSYLETDIPQITTGVWPFTMSFWFKVNAHIGSTWNYLAHLGIRGTHGDSTLVGLQNDQISITTWGDSKINSGVVATPGVWYHVTSTWLGGAFYDNAKLYINAVSYGDTANTRDETSPLSFPTSGNKLTLGKQMNTTSDYFDGSIANFRLFNRALTSDEIYQLYAYQKEDFGHSTNNMTLKAGRLGIGTSEPRAALDVRGVINATRFNTLVAEHTVTSTVDSVEFTGLDLIGDGGTYKIIWKARNTGATNPQYYMTVNGDTTETNYYYGGKQHTNTEGLHNGNYPTIFRAGQDSNHTLEITMTRSCDGYIVAHGQGNFHTGNNLNHGAVQGWELNRWFYKTPGNVTSILFSSANPTTGRYGSGSNIRIHRYM